MVNGYGKEYKLKVSPELVGPWEILKNFFKENNIDFWEVLSINGDVLSKIMCLIYLLDFSTIYRAVIIGVDPFPVKSIDYVKEHL